MGVSSNGKTTDFDSVDSGSTPPTPTSGAESKSPLA